MSESTKHQITSKFDRDAYGNLIYAPHGRIGLMSDLSSIERWMIGAIFILFCVGVPCSLGYIAYVVLMRLAHD